MGLLTDYGSTILTNGSWNPGISAGGKMTAISLTAVNELSTTTEIAVKVHSGRQGLAVSLLPPAILEGGATAVIRIPALYLDANGLLDLYSETGVYWTLKAAIVDSSKDNHFRVAKVPGGTQWTPFLSDLKVMSSIVSNNTGVDIRIQCRIRQEVAGTWVGPVFSDEVVPAGKSCRAILNLPVPAGFVLDVASSGYSEWIAIVSPL